jgi:hypothetical protein
MATRAVAAQVAAAAEAAPGAVAAAEAPRRLITPNLNPLRRLLQHPSPWPDKAAAAAAAAPVVVAAARAVAGSL